MVGRDRELDILAGLGMGLLNWSGFICIILLFYIFYFYLSVYIDIVDARN